MPQTHTIPTGWKTTTLSQVAEIIGGGTPKTTVPEYWNGDIPWLSVVDFNNGNRWVESTDKTITKAGLENSATKILEAGDIIVSARGTVGAFAQLKKPMAFNQSCYGLRAKQGYFNNFLYYLLSTSIKQIQKNVHGAVFDTITRDTFEKIDVIVPPLPEQKEIAAVLSSLDDKIELLRAQNKTLEGMAETLFKQWFMKFDFPDAQGRPYRSSGGKMVESELGEIPAGWRVDSFASTVDILGGGTPKTDRDEYWNGGIPWFSVVDSPSETDVFVLKTEKTISEEGVKNSAAQILPEGTTIITARGTVGKLAVMGIPMAINQSCYGLRAKNGDFPYFTYYMTNKLLQELKQSVHGSVFDTITKETLNGIYTEAPSLTVQEAFEKTVAPVMNRMRANLQEVSSLGKIRDSILPKLMKGALRVKQ
jgi:type I restriction enzyme S subunit